MSPLLVTPGDPAGVGPEVAVRACVELGLDALLIGDAQAIWRWAPGLPLVDRIGPVSGLAVLQPEGSEPVEVASIRLAVQACMDGRGRALVTGPIHKARLAARGFHHAGHTGFLGELCGVEPVMGFVGGDLRVALATVHLPLREVADALSVQGLLHTLRVSERALRQRLGLERPRLLVCGLNPHAGDGGLLGREELEVIEPACELARAQGLAVLGPVSAEAAFRRMLQGQADLVVAMYHDQGLAPLKLVDFGRSVNWTMGLPIVRTSVDHGTADDIAGQGVADASSMKAALQLALRLSELG